MNLFTPIVEMAKLHPNFKHTLADNASGVRKIIQSWAEGFVDKDGKFIHEFQTTYNSGFWELYLFGVLKHLKIRVDFSYPSPDFISIEKNLVIEATIAGHAHDDTPEWEKTILGVTYGDIFEIYKHSAIRLSNAFNAKVQKYRTNYCNLEYVRNKPFIIAISNFTRQDFNLHGDVPMQWLLYDVLEKKAVYKKNGAEVLLGLFQSDAFSEVSAVLYSSLATFGKARALSDDVGNFTFHAIRIKDNYIPIEIIADKSKYKESLLHGLRLFINPFAKHPIQINDFNDSGIRTFIPDKDGNLHISCHQDGDLCMRYVHHKAPKKP